MEQKDDRIVGDHVEVRPGRVLHIWQQKKGDESRPVMLFVHGAGGRKEQWQAQMEHFKETHDIIAYDMVGHGQNDKSGKAVDWYGYGTDHLLHDLLAIVRRFVDPKREDNVLVAHSYGTVISIKLLAHLHSRGVQEDREESEARTDEEEDKETETGKKKKKKEKKEEKEEEEETEPGSIYFRKVVLVGAAGERPAGTAHPIWHLPSLVLEWIRPALGKGFVDKAWHPSTDRELVVRESNIAATNPMHVMRPLFRGMDWTLDGDASLIAGVRFLIISGLEDGVTPVDSAKLLGQWLEEKNSVSIEVVDNAAHMPHMEVPHVVNSLINDFVEAE